MVCRRNGVPAWLAALDLRNSGLPGVLVPVMAGLRFSFRAGRRG